MCQEVADSVFRFQATGDNFRMVGDSYTGRRSGAKVALEFAHNVSQPGTGLDTAGRRAYSFVGTERRIATHV